MLSKIKSVIENESYKFRDLMYLISLYPSKIKTKAFEQLIELALVQVYSKNLLPNVDYQIKLIECLTKSGVSQRIKDLSAEFID